MQHVKENDRVTVVYDGLLENGELFESSSDTGPLQFTLGTNSVLPRFEETVLGMAVGETRTVQVDSAETFGTRQEELVQTFAREIFGDKEIRLGMVLGMQMEQEGNQSQVPALVVGVDNDHVTVDFNHPLAGQTLTYRITVKEIHSA